MKIRTISRHIREGVKNIFRNGWMSFASISSIAISLFLLGLFLMFTINISYIVDQIESKVEISVYMKAGTTEEVINELQLKMAEISQIKSITFVSKEEGLVRLSNQLGENGKALIESFQGEDNPLPDSFIVEVMNPQLVDDAAKQIELLNTTLSASPIEKVKYGKSTVEALFKVTNIIRSIGTGIVLLLSITAVFLIANTIKLTIMARRKEISIMRLVGATNTFIRWPFFIEGALLGFVGSVIPLVILLLGYSSVLNSNRLDLSAFLLQLRPYEDLRDIFIILFLVLGISIGIIGSLMSIRKYLKL